MSFKAFKTSVATVPTRFDPKTAPAAFSTKPPKLPLYSLELTEVEREDVVVATERDDEVVFEFGEADLVVDAEAKADKADDADETKAELVDLDAEEVALDADEVAL